MEDDRPHGAVACGLLVLVGPATVVETARAREEGGVPVGIVVEHEQDLAPHVLALEIVPVLLRGLDPVSHEHDLGGL